MEAIKNKVREVLAIHREVEDWRIDYDPGTPEWFTLVNLSEVAAGLALSLPPEMLPEEELRTPNPREYEVLDELIALCSEEEAK
ncbi:hypothetical protein ACIOGZ_08200 [Kitasatospora sp. NPDC088160]|uniref:hypothetical protein n=1 Tax=Kitasatospora sp. NPDC088160 TaxID=3364072 RepID=UPI0037FE13FC